MATGFLGGFLAADDALQSRDALQLAKEREADSHALSGLLQQEQQLQLLASQQKQKSRQAMLQAAAKIPATGKISDRTDALAQAMFGTEPEEAVRLGEDAIKQRDQEFKLTDARKQRAQEGLEKAADMAAGVDSQESADALWAWAEENDVQMPKYVPRVFNEQTAPTFGRFGQSALTARDRISIQREQDTAKHQRMQEAQTDASLRRQERLADLAERREERLEAQGRERLDLDKKKADQRAARLSKPMSATERKTLEDEIFRAAEDLDTGTGFFGGKNSLDEAGLDANDVTRMADDAHSRTQAKMKEDDTLSREDARDEAIGEVLKDVKREDKDGDVTLSYKRAAVTPSGNAVVKPAAKDKATPERGASKDLPVLTAKTRADVEALKSGTWFRWTDGTIYQRE